MEFTFDTFILNNYEDLKPFFDDLLNRPIASKEETMQWIKDFDSLSLQIHENVNRRYVRHTCDTTNEEYKKAYNFFITDISPKLQEIDDLLNKKIIALPYIDEIEKSDEGYAIWIRAIRKSLAMFREENIPLNTQMSEKEREYGEIAGAMSIEHDGKTITLQQWAKYLELPDRTIRKEVYEKIWTRRGADSEKLDTLLTDLIKLRNTVAKNAGYESFVEYQWDGYNRFDYTQEDVNNFHEWVKQHIVPIVHSIFDKKRVELGLDTLAPFDTNVDGKDSEPLKPFSTGEELLEKGIAVMNDLHPAFAEHLRVMKSRNLFDLSSRTGKAPWGYNTGMPVSGYSFIFMNAAGTQNDLSTFVHEAWHAFHNVYTDNMMWIFSNYPMEIAEVASMSMELITMDFWHHFYQDKKDLIRAKIDQVEKCIEILPWISIIDLFQYWLYKNPDHTIEQRDQKFYSLLKEYLTRVDFSDYETFATKRRQAQLHIFEVPFYYIEYGIAQLGAIGVWKNYMTDPKKALEQYIAALSLGYTKKLPKLYETAGIPFDFSPERIKELAEFVSAEREKLMKQ